MRITGAQAFDPKAGFIRRDVCTTGPRITPVSGDDQVVDAQGCYLIPGLTDLHFHGCMGADFSDGDPQGLVKMADYQLSQGVTQICPAGMTLPAEQLITICQDAARHRKTATSGAMLVGVHLEGPFLSYNKRGAQNAAWLQGPDVALFHRLQEAAEGLVKLVSVAPEVQGGLEFIRQISGEVVVSLAHSEADYDMAAAAFQAGARHVTHTYNAMLPFAPRAPGIVGAAAECDTVMAELICDGVHVHPSTVRATFRIFGKDRMVLVSDTMRAAGMPDGKYTLGGQEVIVKGNSATLIDGILAGSVTNLMDCVRQGASFGIPLADCITAAAVNPAKVLGIYHQVGSLETGKLANMVLLEDNLSLRAVALQGVWNNK